MKQLDIDVSLPAFVWNPYMTPANWTFDLDPCDLWPWPYRPLFQSHMAKTLMNYCPVIFVQEFLFSNFFPVTDTQTDRWTDRQTHGRLLIGWLVSRILMAVYCWLHKHEHTVGHLVAVASTRAVWISTPKSPTCISTSDGHPLLMAHY